jgi:hypothetical protein
MVPTLPAGRGRWLSAALPGVVLVAGLGCVLGGAAGTADWPVVGTFFGAVAGSVVGAVVGVVLTLTLALLARVTRSSWAARLVSGLVAGVAGLGLVGLGSRADALAVVLLATGTVVAGVLGPMIAFGVAPMPDGRPGFTWAAGVWGVCLGWGCALGAAAGAVTGLVIGLDNLPTVVFAAVEGGVLGCVSGLVLACLAAGIAVLPRLHPLP